MPHPSSVHPYATAMNLGVWLLALKEHDEGGKEYEKLKAKLLAPGRRHMKFGPSGSTRRGNFQYTLSEWAVLAGDLELVEAMDGLIDTFRKTQDYVGLAANVERHRAR